MPSGPKNQKYLNRHAAEAQEREQQRTAETKARQAKAAEDAQWANVDKETQRAEQRRAEAEAKRLAELERRAENRTLYEEEQASAAKSQPAKVSKRQMQKDVAKLLAAYDREMATARPDLDTQQKLDEKVQKDAAAGKTARPEEAALDKMEAKAKKHAALDSSEPIDDRHMGKRAKALYKQFMDDTLPTLKTEKPGLRRTQYNDLLWEMWQKSPRNPFVRRAESRAAEALDRERTWMEASDSGSDAEDDAGAARGK